MNRARQQIYVTAEWITQYARSIEYPLQRIDGVLIAPATMPIIFWQEIDIPWMDRSESLIHGSQSFSYETPLKAGMLLDCELILTKVERKTGRQGILTLFTHTLTGRCDGRIIFSAETVLIRAGDEH